MIRRTLVALTMVCVSCYDVYRGNSISDLPDSLGDAECLQVLDLSSNKLTTLPATVCKLVCLQKLLVRNNRLERLPESGL